MPAFRLFAPFQQRRLVRLTPFGADVLDGKVSSYPTNQIEEQVAGARLSSATGPVWFNDNGHLVREK